jgi:hypothetical protein
MTTTPTIGHNRAPFDLIAEEIDDLYGEAKNFADGESITDQKTADAVTALFEGLHAAGGKAEEQRKIEKKPHDDAAKAVQEKFKPLSDKVTRGKSALGELLAPWRKKLADEAASKAAALKAEADAKLAAAQSAIRATSGNLMAREEAEAELKDAKKLAAVAKRVDNAPTGLVTRWVVTTKDAPVALDWAYGRDAARFNELALDMAREAVRLGARALPGFTVTEEKVTRV